VAGVAGAIAGGGGDMADVRAAAAADGDGDGDSDSVREGAGVWRVLPDAGEDGVPAGADSGGWRGGRGDATPITGVHLPGGRALSGASRRGGGDHRGDGGGEAAEGGGCPTGPARDGGAAAAAAAVCGTTAVTIVFVAAPAECTRGCAAGVACDGAAVVGCPVGTTGQGRSGIASASVVVATASDARRRRPLRGGRAAGDVAADGGALAPSTGVLVAGRLLRVAAADDEDPPRPRRPPAARADDAGRLFAPGETTAGSGAVALDAPMAAGSSVVASDGVGRARRRTPCGWRRDVTTAATTAAAATAAAAAAAAPTPTDSRSPHPPQPQQLRPQVWASGGVG